MSGFVQFIGVECENGFAPITIGASVWPNVIMNMLQQPRETGNDARKRQSKKRLWEW